MINPFIAIDEQLHNNSWNKFVEGVCGFIYVKRVGVDVFQIANYDKSGIRFYDDATFSHSNAISVNEKELELFSKKIKEWRKQYGRPSKSK